MIQAVNQRGVAEGQQAQQRDRGDARYPPAARLTRLRILSTRTALAAQFERHALQREVILIRPGTCTACHLWLPDLLDLAAVVADRKGCAALRGAMPVPASDVGVQRFESVDVTESDQSIERSIDSRRRRYALMAQLLDEFVGRARSRCGSQRREHDLLFGVQRFGCSTTVGHGALMTS